MEHLPQSRELEYSAASPMDEAGQRATPFPVHRVLSYLRSYWWIPAVTLLLGSLAAGAFIFWQPAIYISKARMVETLKLRLPEGNLFSEDTQTSGGTLTELLQSARLREETLQWLKNAARESSSNRTVSVQSGEALPPVAIRVSQSSKSSIFTIEASGANPAYIHAYLNALIQVYLDYRARVRAQVSGYTLASISEQVQKAERDLKEEQSSLLAFQHSNNLAILQEEGTVSGGYLARLQTQLSDLQLEDRLLQAVARDQEKAISVSSTVAKYQQLLDLLQTLGKKRQELLVQFAPENSWVVHINEQIDVNEKLKTQLESENPGLASMSLSGDSSPSWVSFPALNPTAGSPESLERLTANRELEGLRIQRERLSKYLKPKHPKIVKLDGAIERAQKLLEMFRRQSQEQLAASRNALRLKIENTQNSIREWEAKVVQANARIAEAEKIKVAVQQKRQIVDRLSLLLQNVGLSRTIDQETLQVLEPASVATRTRSQEGALAGGGVTLGLALGLGIVLLIALRDDRFTSALEVNDKLGGSVVAQVPEVNTNGTTNLLLLEDGKDQHMFAESYRNLRSALTFLAIEGQRPKVILVTSALPNEGKSTVSANLSQTLAFSGSSVLLVDADLRRGALHNLLGFQQTPGLGELLQGPDSLGEIIQTNTIANLHFISAGARLRNPGDRFLSPQFEKLLGRWRQQFDYVIIDCTPVFAADDATTLAPKVDGTLFVVRNRYSGAQQVREALELLYQRQARVLGVVFNRADSSLRSYHYYKYADYYPVKAANEG